MSNRLARLGHLHLLLLMAFVLTPAAIVAIDSFNSATSFPSPFEGFTLRWFTAALARAEFRDAAVNSAGVAVVAAALASVVAFPAAYAIARAGWRGSPMLAAFFVSPILMPEIVLGLTILQLVGLAKLPLGFPILIATHALFVMPFVFRLVLASFRRFDFALEDAARSLGGGRFAAIRLVVLPLVRPSLVAGFTLAAVMSFVNLPISMFLTNPQTATLPVAMYAYMESRIDPMIAAVATLVVVVAAAATLFVDRMLRVRLIG